MRAMMCARAEARKSERVAALLRGKMRRARLRRVDAACGVYGRVHPSAESVRVAHEAATKKCGACASAPVHSADIELCPHARH